MTSTTAGSSARRLHKELKDFNEAKGDSKNGLEGVSAAFVSDDPHVWQVTIEGKRFGGPYTDGVFFIRLNFDSKYPFSPPKVSLLLCSFLAGPRTLAFTNVCSGTRGRSRLIPRSGIRT